MQLSKLYHIENIIVHYQILELVHNKKSDFQLQVASQLDNIECFNVNVRGKRSSKLNDSKSNRTIELGPGDEEIEMCLEEIEKNLVKLR